MKNENNENLIGKKVECRVEGRLVIAYIYRQFANGKLQVRPVASCHYQEIPACYRDIKNHKLVNVRMDRCELTTSFSF